MKSYLWRNGISCVRLSAADTIPQWFNECRSMMFCFWLTNSPELVFLKLRSFLHGLTGDWERHNKFLWRADNLLFLRIQRVLYLAQNAHLFCQLILFFPNRAICATLTHFLEAVYSWRLCGWVFSSIVLESFLKSWTGRGCVQHRKSHWVDYLRWVGYKMPALCLQDPFWMRPGVLWWHM